MNNYAKQEYWAVRCRDCGAMIPLVPLLYELDNKTQKPLEAEPAIFEAECENGHIGTFAKGEILAWLGPLSIPGAFRDHPAIRYAVRSKS
jgi:hypothetical protein